MKDKLHLKPEGLLKIVQIKASMNLGLPETLMSEFKDIVPVLRPLIKTDNIPDPNWISGFVAGDGSFDINIPVSNNKLGYRVQLRFRITQHVRDLDLLNLIIFYFKSGSIYKYPKQEAVSIAFFNLEDITNIIIPFTLFFFLKKKARRKSITRC